MSFSPESLGGVYLEGILSHRSNLVLGKEYGIADTKADKYSRQLSRKLVWSRVAVPVDAELVGRGLFFLISQAVVC